MKMYAVARKHIQEEEEGVKHEYQFSVYTLLNLELCLNRRCYVIRIFYPFPCGGMYSFQKGGNGSRYVFNSFRLSVQDSDTKFKYIPMCYHQLQLPISQV